MVGWPGSGRHRSALTSSRVAVSTAPPSGSSSRIRLGQSGFRQSSGSVEDGLRPNTSIAVCTAGSGPYSREVVASSCAMSACNWTSVVPNSALPNPPNRTSIGFGGAVHRDRLRAQVTVRDAVLVQDAQRVPGGTDRNPVDAFVERYAPRRVCACIVQPRSSDATEIVELTQIQIADGDVIRPRCSTARRTESCSGAVSLARNRSLRQNCRMAPSLRWVRSGRGR